MLRKDIQERYECNEEQITGLPKPSSSAFPSRCALMQETPQDPENPERPNPPAIG